MNEILKKELIQFKLFHKNSFNVYFHIVCGFIFMTCLLLISNKYSYLLLVIYSLIILFTLNDIIVSFIIFTILFVLLCYIKNKNLTKQNILYLFLFFYFLPELSHYLTNEPTVLNINNVTPLTLILNIFYLLPFSLKILI